MSQYPSLIPAFTSTEFLNSVARCSATSEYPTFIFCRQSCRRYENSFTEKPYFVTNSAFIWSFFVLFHLELEQRDVEIVFPHGEVEEEIYMKQPKAFTVSGKENYVCRLKKSLYGLKQAPR